MAKDSVSTYTKIKQFFARMLLIVTKSNGEGVPLAGTNDGALKVFLVGENGASPTVAEADFRDLRESLSENTGWLKVIAFHLAEIRGEEHITPEDLE